MLGIEGLTAWNFDKHVHAIGTQFENLMQQPKMTGEKAIRELERGGKASSGKRKGRVASDLAALVQASRDRKRQQQESA